ncbi:single-stranded DNA-binding protein [Helicobacter enhydrae]|uniref:Single-stranded DNA-binding protein n=1 Tax=Helicobacter enhydrae TaxID=222136 RepID=A0A1B1U694_9HELI|nr:single-stranded DNA-binding protein [Helicobacter enhydrae]ANV98205.1 single-stranded DNA-binding protein [Helicobacter enhydrae]
MYNKVIIVGNLTRDVELRYLPSGSAIATLGIASNRRYKKQDGTQGDETCFVDAKLFGRTAEVANQYLRKGSKILIEGRLTFESWTDQTGAKRSRHIITAEAMQMLDTRADNGSYAPRNNDTPPQEDYTSANYAQHNPTPNHQYTQNIPEINIDDDEIPF